MPGKPPIIELRTSPHAHADSSVEQIMRNVVYALLPVCGYGIYLFGISALALILVVTASCLLTEAMFNRARNGDNSLRDWSAVITGLLLALTLPPSLPLWMGAVSGFVAIALGKLLFGGLGFNVFNPALIGRAFIQAAFPVAITTWTPALAPQRFVELIPSTLAWPFTRALPVDQWSKMAVDSFSGATPLGLAKFESVHTDTLSLFAGATAGSIGETSAALIILCGLYLALRRMLDWRIPVAVMLGTTILAAALHGYDAGRYPSPWFMLFSGGLMLGAWFMATDMVGSPVTPLGVWIYGLLIGMLTVVIRLFGGLPEGVMYAILLANAAAPLIDQLTQPRVYGDSRRKRGEAKP
ncbi:MAG: RnfABCDGE type electron transport complex subunit D [Gammaproteobacteria bacterium]|nr:RnfABCDGE type electron transport complex subunit D [Gammaproteobacteria bacterium]